MIIANRQQHETEQHMLITDQRENDKLSRENKTLLHNFNELIGNQNKMEVWDIWLIIKIIIIHIISYKL